MSISKEMTVSLQGLFGQEKIKAKFEAMLGSKTAGFFTSVLSAVNSNSKLKQCDPMSVMSAAAIAASLDLPINSSLGFAYIIPYAGRATFQMGWRGFVQLALRTGQYKLINAAEVYEGEIKKQNRITGEMEFDLDNKISNKIIGYVAYIKMLNGFEKYFYMTVDECMAHGKKYSQNFAKKDSQWQTNGIGMSLKTVIKLLLSKYGYLSISMVRAIEFDQSIVNQNGLPEYIDNPKPEKKRKPAVTMPKTTENTEDEQTNSDVDERQAQIDKIRADIIKTMDKLDWKDTERKEYLGDTEKYTLADWNLTLSNLKGLLNRKQEQDAFDKKNA